jgi:hypothetical protein
MKKVITILGAFVCTFALLTSCGGGDEKGKEGAASTANAEESKEGGKWDELAKKSGLTKEDVEKAIEIGTKMSDCYQLESAPGAMDSKMTDACDPFMKEYKEYSVSKFGTDDHLGDSAESEKVKAFREIMFDTRNELAESKKK